MKLFILFIILNLSSLTFIQAQEVLQADNLETHQITHPREVLQADNLETHQITHPREVLDAEASIWKIHTNFRRVFYSKGTGFSIGPNLVVTNLHVLEGLLKTAEKLNKIHLTQEGNSDTLNIKQVVSISALYDLALIEINETSQHYLTLSESKVKPDDNLFLTGYPDGIFKRTKKTGNIDYESDSFLPFSINHSKLTGASGSPVLNDQGQVIGVLSQGFKNLILPIKTNHLKKLIKGDIGQNCETTNFRICLEKEKENLKTLAEQGNALAQYKLAFMYFNGDGVIQNYKKALDWYQQSAEQGFALAQYFLGYLYYRELRRVPKNYEKALNWLGKAAEQRFALAQYELGAMYYNGDGVTQNYEKALDLFQQAARQGFAPAQFALGLMHKNGRGVTQNYELTQYWFQKAAEQGNVQAQKKLDKMLGLNEETKKGTQCKSIFSFYRNL